MKQIFLAAKHKPCGFYSSEKTLSKTALMRIEARDHRIDLHISICFSKFEVNEYSVAASTRAANSACIMHLNHRLIGNIFKLKQQFATVGAKFMIRFLNTFRPFAAAIFTPE